MLKKRDTNKHKNRQEQSEKLQVRTGLPWRGWDIVAGREYDGVVPGHSNILFINLHADYRDAFTLQNIIKLYRYNFWNSLHINL